MSIIYILYCRSIFYYLVVVFSLFFEQATGYQMSFNFKIVGKFLSSVNINCIWILGREGEDDARQKTLAAGCLCDLVRGNEGRYPTIEESCYAVS